MNISKSFPALTHKNFRYFFIGSCISLIGTWIQNTSQSWLVLTLTDSPFKLGLITALQFTPLLLFSLFAGAAIDRFSKKKILIIAQSAMMILALILAVLVFTGKISFVSANYEKANKDLPKDKQIDIRVVDNWEKTFEEYKNEILKCICIDDDIEKIKRAKEELLKYDDLEVVSSNYNNFEVMCKGVSKGRAVEILAGYYNIKKEEIICIGDNENDLSMIKYAGLGVAMGNGEKYVKDSADYVTSTNNEDGVAKVIEKFILS
jgi:Cof subfamily protein (haloacid dehalogenase superfamily)